MVKEEEEEIEARGKKKNMGPGLLEKGGVVVVVFNGPPLGVQLACLIGSPEAWRPSHV